MKQRPADYVQLSTRVHTANRKWWVDINTGQPKTLSLSERLLLVLSEITEAMEALRKGLNDDKLPHRNGVEVEMADTVIRLLDMLGAPPEQMSPPIKVSNMCVTLRNVYEYNPKKIPHASVVALFDRISDKTNQAEWLFVLCEQVTTLRNFPYMADIALLIAAIEHYCRVFGYDLWGAFEEKMEYNATRKDHTIEHRQQEGGKKW